MTSYDYMNDQDKYALAGSFQNISGDTSPEMQIWSSFHGIVFLNRDAKAYYKVL